MHCATCSGVRGKVHAERLEDVGATRLAGNRAAAMLCDLCAGRSGDECRGRGNVERVGTVAAGAASIQQVCVIGHLHLGREFAHDLCRRSDLADGFLFYPQPDDDRGDQRWRHLDRS